MLVIPDPVPPPGAPVVPILIFVSLLLGLLALDLGVLNRRAHAVRAGEAIVWTAFWVALALVFGAVVYLAYEHRWLGLGSGPTHAQSGRDALVQYLTGYLIEQSLSLDNIFVIATIFAYFRVPAEFQHRVLFWGIVGVVVMRGAMIAGGAALIHAFDWSVYLFGALLFVSAVKMLTLNTDNIQIESSIVVRAARRLFPIHSEYDGQRFLTRIAGRLHATPLLLVLLLVESADAVFALDSIPAIFAVTTDPFIVFTSNVFAVLGLRSLYFALAAVVHRFHYLKVSLAFLLAFVGVKMALTHHARIDPAISLAVIVAILALGVLASLVGAPPGVSPREGRLGPDVERVTRLTLRQTRKLVVLVIGATVLLLGLAMFVGPGPGVIVIPAGLAILATEFVWARALLRRYRRTVAHAAERAARALHARPRPAPTAAHKPGAPSPPVPLPNVRTTQSPTRDTTRRSARNRSARTPERETDMWFRVRIAAWCWIITLLLVLVAKPFPDGFLRDLWLVLPMITGIAAVIMSFLGAAEVASESLERARPTRPEPEARDERPRHTRRREERRKAA